MKRNNLSRYMLALSGPHNFGNRKERRTPVAPKTTLPDPAQVGSPRSTSSSSIASTDETLRTPKDTVFPSIGKVFSVTTPVFRVPSFHQRDNVSAFVGGGEVPACVSILWRSKRKTCRFQGLVAQYRRQMSVSTKPLIIPRSQLLNRRLPKPRMPNRMTSRLLLPILSMAVTRDTTRQNLETGKMPARCDVGSMRTATVCPGNLLKRPRSRMLKRSQSPEQRDTNCTTILDGLLRLGHQGANDHSHTCHWNGRGRSILSRSLCNIVTRASYQSDVENPFHLDPHCNIVTRASWQWDVPPTRKASMTVHREEWLDANQAVLPNKPSSPLPSVLADRVGGFSVILCLDV